jgi:hypothetical protein
MNNLLKFGLMLICIFVIQNKSFSQDSTFTNLDEKNFNYTQLFDSVYGKRLILNRIPNGVLYDRVYPWSNLNAITQNTKVNKSLLNQTWYDLSTSTYAIADEQNYDQFKNKINQYDLTHTTFPFVVYDYNYSFIDSLAITDGRMKMDKYGILTDNNLSLLPYGTRNIRMGGLLTNEVESEMVSNIVLSKELFLSNTDRKIVSVSILNSTTNETFSISEGEIKRIMFNKIGLNQLEYTFTLDDQSAFSCSQNVQVRERLRGGGCEFYDVVESKIPFKGYDEPEPTTSFGDYHIFYRYKPNGIDCEDKLKKPVLFLDGFDARNGRNYQAIYSNYLTITEGDGTLAEELRHNGFDVVILNFPRLNEDILITTDNIFVKTFLHIPAYVHNASNQQVNRSWTDGGTDYIERNAMVFIALVQKLDSTLNANLSSEKLAIVGPSMGGQISRYGLAYMEKQYALTADPVMQHNCREWISFDSPHDGANIPIGLQQGLDFLGNFAGQQDVAINYESQIRSKAARQLLIEQNDGLNRTASFHSSYYDNLNSNGLPNSHGYPQNLRKVALINGASNGANVFNAGGNALDVVGDTYLGITGFEANLKFMPNTGNSTETYKGSLIDPPGWQWSLPYYTSSSTTSSPTSGITKKYFQSKYTLPGFWLYHYIIKHYKGKFTTINNNPNGSMDVVPGGRLSAIQDFYVPINTQLQSTSAIKAIHLNTLNASHTFIPAISALGFKNPNFNWSTRFDDRNLVCNNEIYFDGYYSPPINEDHVHISQNSSQWAYQEILKGHQGSDCVDLCGYTFQLKRTDLPLGQDGLLCYGSSYTYQIVPAPPVGATVQLYTSEYQAINVTVSNNSITFTVDFDSQEFDGSPMVHCIISNPCGAEKITATAGIQIPPPSSYPSLFSTYCYSEPLYGIGAINLNNTNYTWSLDQGQNFAVTTYSDCPFNYFLAAGPLPDLVLTVSNVCYNVSETFVGIVPDCREDGHGQGHKMASNLNEVDNIIVHPNPSSDIWYVTIPNQEKQDLKMALQNLQGQTIWNNTFIGTSDKIFQIPNSNLVNGIYILKIKTKNQTKSFKLIKD